MKKRIIFVTNSMVLGGIEKSLLDLMYLLPEDQFEISLLLDQKRGEYLPYIPEHVNIFQLQFSEIDRLELNSGRTAGLKYALKKFRFGYVISVLRERLKWYLEGRKYSFDYSAFDAILRRTPQIFEKEFDIAAAYFGDMMYSTCVVLTYLQAKTKICWSHSEQPDAQMDPALQKKYYSRFQHRFACSQATADRINHAIGRNVVRAVPHVLAVSRMKKMALEEQGVFPGNSGVPVVLTVARLDEQKGIDIAIEVHDSLMKKGRLHRWYLIGNGSGNGDEEKYRKMVMDRKLTESFIFLGGKTNPYPYFRECDIYVQPSRFEGYCIAVAEARVFCKPIVAADFDGAREQIRDQETGLIVPCTAEAISGGLEKLLLSEPLRKKFSNQLSDSRIDSQSRVLDLWNSLADEISG